MITLFQHQQQALDQTEGHNRCAYYLDMGLGKTFVGSEKALKLNSRVNLLICQCSKVSDWIDHMVENYAMNHCWMINVKTPVPWGSLMGVAINAPASTLAPMPVRNILINVERQPLMPQNG